MGKLIEPGLFVHFTDDETQVVDVFGNVIKSFPYTEEGDEILEANRYIAEFRRTHACT